MRGLEFVIRRFKNDGFRFDPSISLRSLLRLASSKSFELCRGLLYRLPRGSVTPLYLGRRVRFEHTGGLSFGKNVVIGDYCKLSALGKGGLILGHNVSIGAFSRIIVSSSFSKLGESVRIGDHVGIGEFSYIGGGGGVSIGAETIVGQYFSVHPENHHFDDLGTPVRYQGVDRKGIMVGENCWIGSKVTILDGVSIGRNCIIAAGAVVVSTFPDNCVIGGVPARLLRKR